MSPPSRQRVDADVNTTPDRESANLVRLRSVIRAPLQWKMKMPLSSVSQSLDDRGYRVPIARRTRNTEAFLHLTEITDCLHLPFVKTEKESASAAAYFQDPFAVGRKFPRDGRELGQSFR